MARCRGVDQCPMKSSFTTTADFSVKSPQNRDGRGRTWGMGSEMALICNATIDQHGPFGSIWLFGVARICWSLLNVVNVVTVTGHTAWFTVKICSTLAWDAHKTWMTLITTSRRPHWNDRIWSWGNYPKISQNGFSVLPKWLLSSGKKRMMLHDVTHIGMSICPSPARICSKRKLTTQGFIRNQQSGEIRSVVGEIHHASEWWNKKKPTTMGIFGWTWARICNFLWLWSSSNVCDVPIVVGSFFSTCEIIWDFVEIIWTTSGAYTKSP